MANTKCQNIKTATLGAGSVFEVSYDCGETFEWVRGMTAIGATGDQSETVETTAIDDEARTYIAALGTPPQKNFTGNFRPELDAQARFHQAAINKEVVVVRATFPTKPTVTRATQTVALLGFQVNEPAPDAALTFTANGQASGKAEWSFFPFIPVTAVTMSEDPLTGAVGTDAAAGASVSPADATNKSIKYDILDTSVATVDELTGIVTFLKVGETTLTATSTDGGFVRTRKVVVTE